MLEDTLKGKIKVLQETVWERRAPWDEIEEWLSNFAKDIAGKPSERLHALFLLSQFMYFGNKEMRELLRAMYRDLYRYPLVAEIRKTNRNTIDMDLIRKKLRGNLKSTRFLGIGNPSESGPYLLYYFRQENELPKNLFIHTHQIFSRSGRSSLRLKAPDVTKYVFIDDLCGSGDQAVMYSRDIVSVIKTLNRKASVAYYVLFATTEGLKKVERKTAFDDVKCIFELDNSFKSLEKESRYFTNPGKGIDQKFARKMCEKYGRRLIPAYPLGYRGNQLLVGFYHNTPDNTLPIIWCDESESFPWKPIFRRYPKAYGWSDVDG